MIIKLNNNTFIAACEFSQKDEVKNAGFRWNREARRWETPHVIAVKRLKDSRAGVLAMDEEAREFYLAEIDRFNARPRCGRCAGTGKFITAVVNGQPTGPGGICYRCEGSGTLSARDEERNDNYDRGAMARAFREMLG
jgi:hypothetical protein